MLTEIPTPDMSSMQKIATISDHAGTAMTAYWNKDTREVTLYHTGALYKTRAGWFAQQDSPIVDTLAELMSAGKSEIGIDNIVVYDKAETVGETDDEDTKDIYDCIWSDLVIGGLVVHCSVHHR